MRAELPWDEEASPPAARVFFCSREGLGIGMQISSQSHWPVSTRFCDCISILEIIQAELRKPLAEAKLP